MGIRAVHDGQANLLEIVLALGTVRSLADFLHGWNQQGDQNGDNGDDDQQLDEGKTSHPPQQLGTWHEAPLGKKNKGIPIKPGDPTKISCFSSRTLPVSIGNQGKKPKAKLDGQLKHHTI
jgi:hypothetical protein